MPSEPTNATFSTASRGFSWSFVASILVLVASLAAQFYLGRLLSLADFGIYAIAMGFANVLVVLRDGGVNRWLSRMTRDEFDSAVDRAMMLAIVSCIAVAAVIAISAPFVGRAYGQPQVTTLLWVFSLGLAISPYSVVGLARLNVDLRFREMAWLKLASGILRYGLTILLAFYGFGALSLAWPVVAISIFETAVYFYLTRIPVRISEFSWAGIKDVLSESRWSLSGSFSEAILRQGDYLVLGLLVPIHVVGVYCFAFQLAMQPVVLFSESLRKVVMPIFSQLTTDKERESRSIRYSSLFIGAVAAPALLLLAVTAEPVLTLLWGTKWALAVRPLQVFVLAMPLHLLASFAESLLQSRGMFRVWTFSLLIRGIGLGVAAWLATIITNASATELAYVLAAYLAISAIIEVYILMRKMDLSFQPLVQSLPVPLLCSTVSALAIMFFTNGHGLNGPLDQAVFLTALFVVAVIVVFWIFCRPALHELTRLARRTKAG